MNMNKRVIFFVLILSSGLLLHFSNSQDEKGETKLITKSYRIPATFVSSLVPWDPWGNAPKGEGGSKIEVALKKAGMMFPEGSRVTVNEKKDILSLTNNAEGIEFLEALLEGFRIKSEHQVHVICEWIEVDHMLFSDWLFENRFDEDGTKLRNQAQEWIKHGKGTIIESKMVISTSGNRAKAESVREFIYPTEYEPSEVPKEVTIANGAKAPVTAVTPTAFEVRNVGTTLEVDPVVGGELRIIDLNLAPEIVKLVGMTEWIDKDLEGKFKTHFPTFYTQKITSQVTIRSGRYAFLGTTRPPEPENPKITKDPIVLHFVRGDVSSQGDWSIIE